MKLTPLSEIPVTTKVLITCFLATLGFGNIAAGIYTAKYVGLSYDSLVETYSDREAPGDHGHPTDHPHRHGPNGEHLPQEETLNEFGEKEITLDEVKEMPHKVGLKLLLQDAHVHLFSHGVLALCIGILFLWSGLSTVWKLALIPLPFLAGTLDFAGMFLVKFVADGFAWLILFAGGLNGLSFSVAFFLACYEMWFLPLKNKKS